MTKSLFEQLSEAEAKAAELRRAVGNCNHFWQMDDEQLTTVATTTLEPDPYMGFFSSHMIEVRGPSLWGKVQRRRCSFCASIQKRESKSPGSWSDWK